MPLINGDLGDTPEVPEVLIDDTQSGAIAPEGAFRNDQGQIP